jgi:hypothetical protein
LSGALAKLQEFHLGRTDFDNSGLVVFKGRWSTTRSILADVQYAAGTSQLAREGHRMRVTKQVKPVFAHVPDGLPTPARKLLDRCIG